MLATLMSNQELRKEIVFKRMHECTVTLGEKYIKAVRAIYGCSHNQTPIHIGSAILLEYGKEKLLITAAHVLDNNAETTLYVNGSEGLLEILGDVHITNSPSKDRKDDDLDFGFMSLSDEFIEKLGDVYFITEDEFLLSDLGEKERLGLALGYPNSKNKKHDNINNKITPSPFVYSSTLRTDRDVFIRCGFNIDTHFLLDFCHKKSKDENNTLTNSVAPKGISGGGLFLIEGMSDPESYKLGTPCSGKLIGMQIEINKIEKVLISVKLSVIINALTKRSREEGGRGK